MAMRDGKREGLLQPVGRCLAALALALTAALIPAAGGSADEADEQARAGVPTPELYRWQDRYGAVRYTPDLDRIPDSRRDTAIRVIRSAKPESTASAAQPGAMTIPTPGQKPPSATATLGAPMPDADPFNAPSEARRVQSQDLTTGSAGKGSWPELDARIAELEVLVARDEEAIKQMISTPASGEYDELIHSQELREIAARLPILQGELEELRRWREEPDRR